MFCQNCGKEIGETDRFCPNCGVVTGYTNENGTPAEQEQGAADTPEGAAFVSFDPSSGSGSARSDKTVTGILVGVVSAIGLITLIILLILQVAASRKAAPKLEQWKNQSQDSHDPIFQYGDDSDDDLDDGFDSDYDFDGDYDFNEIF